MSEIPDRNRVEAAMEAFAVVPCWMPKQHWSSRNRSIVGKRKKKSSSAKTRQPRTGVPLAAVRLHRMAKFTPQTMRNATKYYAKNLTSLKSEADSTVVTCVRNPIFNWMWKA